MNQPHILRVAVSGPFRQLFSYLPVNAKETSLPLPGSRVLIPFGKRKVIGILIEVASNEAEKNSKYQLKSILEYLDEKPVFDPEQLAWLEKVAQYYHYPIGDTLLTALPVALRKESYPKAQKNLFWKVNNPSIDVNVEKLRKAPKQLAIYEFIKQQKSLVSNSVLNEKFPGSRGSIKSLLDKNFISQVENTKSSSDTIDAHNSPTEKNLTDEQENALSSMEKNIDNFKVMLLNGVTGSGKTEVYIQLSKKVVAQNKQVLVLLPEIALTPQLVSRFKSQFDCPIDVLHSGLNDTERYTVWHNIKNNQTQILIGTRSSIFSPFNNLGLIIIDEEHDLSFKQQDGLRYSTKDIAILRASLIKIPVLLGSATPSLESIANTRKPHYAHLRLKNRAGKAIPPKISTVNIKGRQLVEGLSNELIQQIKETLTKDEQVLLFLNQRGYAPALICHECGDVEKCPRCERNMTIHHARQRITCHHCGYEKKLPKSCSSCGFEDLRPIGYGTERIENCLKTLFPDTDTIRIDRDTTSRKNAVLELLKQVDNNKGQILLGTQMLAKGHDFPNVTLVGILNADQGLFGADLRSEERLAQLIIQVAGRAGRGDKPGHVLVQTHHPEHPLWNTLINESYDSFAEKALTERENALFPPFSFAALFRSESTNLSHAFSFLNDLNDAISAFRNAGVEIYGPVPAPMEKKAGKFRTQLLLMSASREKLHQCIDSALRSIDKLKSAKKIRWNLDVDPLDMS